MIQVKCALTDCMNYRRDPKDPSRCLCSHPDKKFYLDAPRCPLYRMDWSAQADRILVLQERFKDVK